MEKLKQLYSKFINWWNRVPILRVKVLDNHNMILQKTDSDLQKLKIELNGLRMENLQLKDKVDDLSRNFNIGIDVRRYEKDQSSWAVTCLNHKHGPEVTFYDLRGMNLHEIEHFMKRFKYYNKTRDDIPWLVKKEGKQQDW